MSSKPFIIVSTPRSRGDLLRRILAASEGLACGNGDMLLKKMADMGELVKSPIWKQSILGNLRAVAGADGVDRFGIVDRFAGHEGWDEANALWRWWLDAFPELKIIFLGRDQGRVEMGMEVTYQNWVPDYGACLNQAGGNVRGHLESMDRFAGEHPESCVRIDAEDVLDFPRLSALLDQAGIVIAREAWEAQLAIVTNSTREAAENPPTVERDPTLDDWGDVGWAEPVKRVPRSVAESQRPARVFMVSLDEIEDHARDVEVHTLRYGAPEWMPPCADSLDDWCGRHGYALRVHGRPVGLCDEKFAVIDMIREFLDGQAEVMLFVDGDVIIHPSAPGWPVSQKGFVSAPDKGAFLLRGWQVWQQENGIVLPRWTYRNTGVWSIDRAAAVMFLDEVEQESFPEGYRERYHLNAWTARANAAGMRLGTLGVEWNQSLDDTPAWFFHLTGSDKLKKLRRLFRNRLLPPPGTDFEELPPPGIPRAICYPWLESSARWHELRFSLRSIHRHFEDRECPIIILGPTRPRWLLEDSGRVRWIQIDYSESAVVGLREAFRVGLQVADEVLWMNDDIYLIGDCGWQDFSAAAFTEGRVDTKIDRHLDSKNSWQHAMAYAAVDLQHHGAREVMRTAAHTPTYHEREKSIEIFRKFHVPYKGAFSILYHNFHGRPMTPIGKRKVNSLAPEGIRPGTFLLNHNDTTLNDALMRGIAERFADEAPWETADKIRIELSPSVAGKYFGAGAVVWPYKESEAEGDELAVSVQSVRKFWSEKEWPLVLCSETRPEWWTGEFIHAPSYEEALLLGTQCAERVLWMNDDIAMISHQSPETYAVAYHHAEPVDLEKLSLSSNSWTNSFLQVLHKLAAKGFPQRNFETHLPYLLERDKCRAVFSLYGAPHKLALATAYHNTFRTACIPLAWQAVACNAPDLGDAQWANFLDGYQTEEFRAMLLERVG